MAEVKSYSTEDYRKIQIDVKEINDKTVTCDLYTGVYCAKVVMSRVDYNYLVHKGFFINDGKNRDAANVWNTTEEYRIPSTMLIKESIQ